MTRKNKKKNQKKQAQQNFPIQNPNNSEDPEGLDIYYNELMRGIQRLQLSEETEEAQTSGNKLNIIEKIENNLFKVYYDQKRHEQETFDFDELQMAVERDCYSDQLTKSEVDEIESSVIIRINEKRAKESKKPIMFHFLKSADFDITREEIEEQLRDLVPKDDVSELADNFKQKVAPEWAKCVYDYLEEKYKLDPILEEECSEDEKDVDSDQLRVEKNDNYSFEGLKKMFKSLNRQVKNFDESMWDKKIKILVEQQREVVRKGIKLYRQVEKLKEYKKSCPEYKDRLELMIKAANTVFKTKFCCIKMDAMDKMVDSAYLFLIRLRYGSEAPPLTLHRIGGEFDLTIEEVQNAFGPERAGHIFQQLENRFYFVKRAEKRIQQGGND